jgi:hypothetical protein
MFIQAIAPTFGIIALVSLGCFIILALVGWALGKGLARAQSRQNGGQFPGQNTSPIGARS